MQEDHGTSAAQTGPSQAEPEVSALRASVPSALADALELRLKGTTEEALLDGGRYFDETFTDLTRCGHGDTGEYTNDRDGLLIQFLWNNRLTILAALRAASAMSARSAETEGLSPKDASAVGEAETPKP